MTPTHAKAKSLSGKIFLYRHGVHHGGYRDHVPGADLHLLLLEGKRWRKSPARSGRATPLRTSTNAYLGEHPRFEGAVRGLGSLYAHRSGWRGALRQRIGGSRGVENHGTRPEVAAAEADGECAVTRYSDTLRTDTVYAAVLLDDGSIIACPRRASRFSVRGKPYGSHPAGSRYPQCWSCPFAHS